MNYRYVARVYSKIGVDCRVKAAAWDRARGFDTLQIVRFCHRALLTFSEPPAFEATYIRVWAILPF
jgi:hypothetical protein